MVIRPLAASQATCPDELPEPAELSTRFPPQPAAISPTTRAPARIVELRVSTTVLLVCSHDALAGHQVHDDRGGEAGDPDADADRLQVEQEQGGRHCEHA